MYRKDSSVDFGVLLTRFSTLNSGGHIRKGIEGRLDFSNRNTVINQVSIKSIDPRRIISAAIHFKRKLYDTVFEPQKFIDSLLQYYKEILKEEGWVKSLVGNYATTPSAFAINP